MDWDLQGCYYYFFNRFLYVGFLSWNRSQTVGKDSNLKYKSLVYHFDSFCSFQHLGLLYKLLILLLYILLFWLILRLFTIFGLLFRFWIIFKCYSFGKKSIFTWIKFIHFREILISLFFIIVAFVDCFLDFIDLCYAWMWSGGMASQFLTIPEYMKANKAHMEVWGTAPFRIIHLSIKLLG